MGVGNFLHKLGRGAAGLRLSMHGYTPERLEAERQMLADLYAEREAERARRDRAEQRAEDAARRAEERAQREEEERQRANAFETARIIAGSTIVDENLLGPVQEGDEFLSTIPPEIAALRGIKPGEQADVVLALARREVQARRDAAKQTREQAVADKAATDAEGWDEFQRRARFTASLRPDPRPEREPADRLSPFYSRAESMVEREAQRTLADWSAEEVHVRALALAKRLEEEAMARKLGRPAPPTAPEPNPFAVGAFGEAGIPLRPTPVTGAGQPVGQPVGRVGKYGKRVGGSQ